MDSQINNQVNNQGYNEYEEIDLKELFMVIWDSKWLIIAITIALVLIAGIYSFFIAEPVYETSSEIYTPDYELVNGTSLNNDEYISFFRSPEIKQELINSFGLEEMTFDGLDNKLTVSTSDARNNVVLKLKDVDNQLAADLLNEWVRLFSRDVENYMSRINTRYIDKIENLMSNREARYIAAKNRLTEFEKKNNLSLYKMRLNTKNNQLVDYENRVFTLKNDIKVLEERNRLLVEQLEKTERFIVTNETLDDSSMKALVELFEGDSNLQTIITQKENINEIYMTIQKQLNDDELNLSSKKEESQLLNADIDVLEDEIVVLKEKVVSLDEEQKLLNLRLDETKENYQETERLYNTLVQQQEREDYNITTISRAVVPETSVSPNKKMNVAIAGVLGIFLSVFIVFIRKYFSEEDNSEA